jgi:hypothetical protein
MNQKPNGITIDPAAVLERLPGIRAALAEGKIGVEYVLHNVPGRAQPETRKRLERIEQAIKEVEELEAYIGRVSNQQ